MSPSFSVSVRYVDITFEDVRVFTLKIKPIIEGTQYSKTAHAHSSPLAHVL
jgi:hypothetical protein